MSEKGELITVSSALISPAASKALTPAMTAVIWQIGALLDEARVPAQVDNSVWLEVPARRLRGPASRPDNIWLRECLERLNETRITGEYRGSRWGAVLLAEWHLEKGGETVRLLVPPAAVLAIRSPETFAKIETEALYRLSGRASRLYAALADRKRMGRTSWTYSLDELRAVFAVEGGYPLWRDFRQRVLLPAVEAVNDFGPVTVRMTPEKLARRIVGVRFDWRWRDPHGASETVAENERHSAARGRGQERADAPPLVPETRYDRDRAARRWWEALPPAERTALEAEIRAEPFTPLTFGGRVLLAERSDKEVVRRAYERAHPDRPKFEDLA